MDLLMTCDVFLGMMQTAANEGEAGEEETKGTGGLCARERVSGIPGVDV